MAKFMKPVNKIAIEAPSINCATIGGNGALLNNHQVLVKKIKDIK